MRAAFLVLVVSNVLFLVWNLAFGEDSAESDDALVERQIAASYVDAPELTMVNERRPNKAEDALDSAGPASYDRNEFCWLLGPFDDSDLAESVYTRLQTMGVGMDLERIASPVAPDYWVHIVPQQNRQAAIQLLRGLQRRKIDSFIIAEGELENGISLGFYSDEKTARRQLAQHEGQPYKVDIQLVPRNIEEFWGVVRAQEYDKLSEQAWNRFRNENGNLKLDRKSCSVIASAK